MSGRVLNGGGSSRQAIRAWLLGFLSFCSGELGSRGCLSVNTNLEASVLSPDVRASIDQFQKDTEVLLCAAFDRGKASGEFAVNFDSAGVARALLVAQSGLMVLARGRPPAAKTLDSMERLLNALVPEPAGSTQVYECQEQPIRSVSVLFGGTNAYVEALHKRYSNGWTPYLALGIALRSAGPSPI